LTFFAKVLNIISMSKATKTLASFIAEAREKSGLTLRAVEKETGISNAYLSQLEHGKIQTPAPQNLHKLAGLYRVPYELLMELAGYPVPQTNAGPPAETMAARFGSVTREEEDALVEYLQFLRQRKKGR
jgi:transcriptional regulator with XRE-family HTH domain